MDDDHRHHETRVALARLISHGIRSTWMPEIQTLFELPVVQQKLKDLGEHRADTAIRTALRDAVEQLGRSQYRRLLTIVLALDEQFEGLPVKARRTIAGQEFRGGDKPVTAGTIRQYHEPRALDQLASVLLTMDRQPEPADFSHSSSPPTPSFTNVKLVEWHPVVHTMWAEERLQFWLLSFSTYDREPAVERLRKVMHLANVRSWAVYELLGMFDLLVRVWQPATAFNLHEQLIEAFRDHDVQVVDRFLVDDVVTHWPWASQRSEFIDRPDAARLERQLTSGELAHMQDTAWRTGKPPASVQGTHLLTVAAPADGFEFVTTITSTRGPTSFGLNASLSEKLADFLSQQEQVFEVSLYRGTGFGNYLIQAKLPFDAFRGFGDALLSPLRALLAPLDMRTTTFPIASHGPLVFEESIWASAVGETASAEQLIRTPESQSLDVRGFAFSSPRSLFEGLPPERDERVGDKLLRTITGMLNAEGGTILIGASDQSRVPQTVSLTDVPIIGEYVVHGIDHEMERGWDDFARRLWTMCSGGIEPDPTDWLSIDREQIEGQTVSVVRVQASPRTWFYQKSKGRTHDFVVRQGGATRLLSGPKADHYKVTKPRG